jgi:hypothetical protein
MPQKEFTCKEGHAAVANYARGAAPDRGMPNMLVPVGDDDEGAVCEGGCHRTRSESFLLEAEEVIR